VGRLDEVLAGFWRALAPLWRVPGITHKTWPSGDAVTSTFIPQWEDAGGITAGRRDAAGVRC